MAVADSTTETWPALPLAEWHETLDTLHMWLQVIGKIKLELVPFLNEWWNVGLAVTATGLTTGLIPNGERAFQIDLDFIRHNLAIQTSDGAIKAMPLIPRSVANFYAELMATLGALGIDVTINTLPAEVPNPIRCDINETHAAYDGEYANRWWRILLQTAMVLQRFRTPFTGKSSPILFYWGSFDLGYARFSGRPADPPAEAPRFYQIAEDQENFACGFWPGNASASGRTFGEPAFYAYHSPAPPSINETTVRPEAARFDSALGEFILRYDDARRSADPAQAVLAFFQSTYEAATRLSNWDRDALERSIVKGSHR